MASQKQASLISAKLRKADASVKAYVAALRTENAKLQRHVARLEVQALSNKNRLKALETEFEANRPKFDMRINLGDRSLTNEELIERVRALGYRVEKVV